MGMCKGKSWLGEETFSSWMGPAGWWLADPLLTFSASFVHGTKHLGTSALVTNVGVDGVRFKGLFLQKNWDCMYSWTVTRPLDCHHLQKFWAAAPTPSLVFMTFWTPSMQLFFPFWCLGVTQATSLTTFPCFPQRNKKSQRRFPSESVQWRKYGATWRCCGRCWACTAGPARPCLTRRPCR